MVEKETAPGKIDPEDSTFQFIKSRLIPAFHERKDEDVSTLVEELNSDSEDQITPDDVLDELYNRMFWNYDPRGLSPETLAHLFDNLSSELEPPAILNVDFPY